jgi:SGNH hydrolase-like domain, acetyltransferase AlgX
MRATLFLSALAIGLAAGFAGGHTWKACKLDHSRPPYHPATASQPMLMPPAVDEAIDRDAERVARTEAIRRTKATIEAELQQAGGDWARWQRQTEACRQGYAARCKALEKGAALEGRNGFPLLEIRAAATMQFLYEPQSIDAFRRDKPVVAVSRWLKQRGVDLIFVPAPKMSEVYVEQFFDSCPADGVVAPHVRHAVLEMLDDDVEAIDAFSILRAGREKGYVYLSADTHWSAMGQSLVAGEIAGRLQRYDFARLAKAAVPISKTETVRPDITQEDVPDSPASPVLLVGDSYVPGFREQLIRATNLRVRTAWAGGITTEPFAEIVLDEDKLAGVRVIVWVVSNWHLAQFKPLPPTIVDALE